ncbi:MAG: relaxase/mobilization nuclease domain-containing protein [Chitinophagaceae bacterium]
MVARITFPKILLNALNYHEQKVNKGAAECLLAENFLLDEHQLKFYDKLNRFKSQIELNTSVKTTLLHASLNFEPSESFSKDELIQIATSYMSKIGFSDQPYLVYQHEDAGHPHIHILTTTIKDDCSPIYVHNIGRNQSQKARAEIEEAFHLIKASGRNHTPEYNIPAVDIQKVIYGKSETKRSIVNVLDAVLNRYKFSSLAELNAVLQLSNVIADTGKEGGRIHKNAGLVYRILDNAGNKIGKPIKSSSIYSKPTLPNLEKIFQRNKNFRYPSRADLKTEIAQILDKSRSMLEFTAALKDHKIDTIIRRNNSGFVYGITFVDHKSKCVFNGSDLGKQLSAAGIQQKLNASTGQPENKILEKPTTKRQGKETTFPKKSPRSSGARSVRFEIIKERTKSSDDLIRQYQLLKDIMQSEKTFNPTPFGLTRKKKRKKRKPNQSH